MDASATNDYKENRLHFAGKQRSPPGVVKQGRHKEFPH